MMSSTALKVRAAVQMQPASELPVAKPLNAGWGTNIFVQDKFFPGRILECDKPIEPGGTGEVVIGIMESTPHAAGLQLGSVFELRDGPAIKIATAQVHSFC